MNSTIQTTKSLRCSLGSMRGELLNYICCSQKDRWLLKVGQPHFSNKDKADETTSDHSRIMNSRGYYWPLPAKGVEVVASWSSSCLGKGEGALCTLVI